VAGEKIDEVFIGSCMTNLSHFSKAASILRKDMKNASKLWISPPTRLVEEHLKETGEYDVFKKIGARLEIPDAAFAWEIRQELRITPLYFPLPRAILITAWAKMRKYI